MSAAAAALLALPWWAGTLAVLWRARRSRSLDDADPTPPAEPELLSVIVPARDERRNIGRCVRSLLASTWPALEVIVVDDHSTDGTGDAAREAAAGDPRLVVVPNPDLPPGWFGKQWACATGAAHARGELLLFTDADTAHGPELHARAVAALRARGADLLTVGGAQELGSFWETVVQPQPFAVILARYGGTEHVERSPRVTDKIANGQFMLFRRASYEALGGHAAVRDRAAEDLALAQRTHALGMRLAMVEGERHLRTRMYASLAELVRGWTKNVYAAGREAMWGGRAGRAVFPFLLALPPLLQLAPVAGLVAGLVAARAGAGGAATLAWSLAALAPVLLFWALAYARLRRSPAWALLFPLGALVFLGIVLAAVARGRRVAWKGRTYRAA